MYRFIIINETYNFVLFDIEISFMYKPSQLSGKSSRTVYHDLYGLQVDPWENFLILGFQITHEFACCCMSTFIYSLMDKYFPDSHYNNF